MPPWICGSNSGWEVKIGSRSTAKLTFTVPERLLPGPMSATKSAGSSPASIRSQERDLRVRGRDHRRRGDLLAGLQRHPGDPAVGGVDPGDRRARSGSRAGRAAACPIACGDRTHAAAREAPGAGLTVDGVADVVVQHHVRGAGAARTGPHADDTGDREHAAHRVGLEAVLDDVGEAGREQAGEVERRADVDAAQLARQPGLRQQIGRLLRAELRRDLVAAAGRRTCRAGHPAPPSARTRRRPLGELRDLLVPLLRIVRQREVAPSRRGAKYGPCG